MWVREKNLKQPGLRPKYRTTGSVSICAKKCLKSMDHRCPRVVVVVVVRRLVLCELFCDGRLAVRAEAPLRQVMEAKGQAAEHMP